MRNAALESLPLRELVKMTSNLFRTYSPGDCVYLIWNSPHNHPVRAVSTNVMPTLSRRIEEPQKASITFPKSLADEFVELELNPKPMLFFL